MSNTNDGGPAFPGTAPMDTEKLIEELPWLLGKYTNGSYWMRDAECDSIRNTILSALRSLAAAEKVVEAARVAHAAAHLRTHGFDGGDISDLDFSKMLPAIVDLDSALSAYDAAKEPQ